MNKLFESYREDFCPLLINISASCWPDVEVAVEVLVVVDSKEVYK